MIGATRPYLSVRDLMRVAGVLGVAALALTIWVAYEGSPIAGDIWLAQRIQEAHGFERNAGVINGLGGWRWLPFAVVVLLLSIGRRLDGGEVHRSRSRSEALFALAAVVALVYGDNLLKDAVQSPRPLAALGVRIDEFQSSYGFPSGHVYGDVLFYGAMAVFAPLWVPQRLVLPVRALAFGIVLLAGPARVVVGAHWPSDVLGGYLWGGFALCIALAFGRWITSRAAP
jgi:membrane-associated phospholipid phosphatase